MYLHISYNTLTSFITTYLGIYNEKNALYAQSGGVTAVINATAGALILEARKSNKIGKVFAAENGILGALEKNLLIHQKNQ